MSPYTNIDTVTSIDNTIKSVCEMIQNSKGTVDLASTAKLTSALAELVSARADIKTRF